MRRLFVGLAILMILQCVGCSADEGSNNAAYDEPTEAMVESASDWDTSNSDMEEFESVEVMGENNTGEVEQSGQKLVYTLTLQIETMDYESSVKTVEELTEQYGGYIEYANIGNDRISGGENQLRMANFTLRIPADKLGEFETTCSSVGSVYDSRLETENKTAVYVDLSARLKTYQTEEETLLNLLAEAENMESIIALNSRLSEVRYEIESIESNLRNIDSLVSYSTIYISLYEVITPTPLNEDTPRTFSERVSASAAAALDNFKSEISNIGVYLFGQFPLALLLFLIRALPWIILIIIIIVVVRKIIRRRRIAMGLPVKQTLRKHRKENADAEQNNE